MRSFLLPLAVLFVVCVAVQLVLPWWSITPVCLAGGYLLGRGGGTAFGAGFLAVAGGWALAAGAPWLMTHSELPARVAKLLSLPGGGIVLLILAAGLAGVLGGIAAMAGWWLRMTKGRGTNESF